MTFTQSSFLNQQPDLIVAIKPNTRSQKKTTVCIPETVPAVAVRPNPKNMTHANTYSLVLILLLSIVMVFLMIQSFNGIQALNSEISTMQRQLDAATAQEAEENAKLQQQYQNLDPQSVANSLGMVSKNNAVQVVLPE